MAIYQLHWQNIKNPTQSVLVAQHDASTPEEGKEMMKRFREIASRRKGECPEGWGTMVCDDSYAAFVYSKREAGSFNIEIKGAGDANKD